MQEKKNTNISPEIDNDLLLKCVDHAKTCLDAYYGGLEFMLRAKIEVPPWSELGMAYSTIKDVKNWLAGKVDYFEDDIVVKACEAYRCCREHEVASKLFLDTVSPMVINAKQMFYCVIVEIYHVVDTELLQYMLDKDCAPADILVKFKN